MDAAIAAFIVRIAVKQFTRIDQQSSSDCVLHYCLRLFVGTLGTDDSFRQWLAAIQLSYKLDR